MFEIIIIWLILECKGNVIVNTTYGLVSGTITHNGRVQQFLSIPYASPPINDLRWKHPIIHNGWNYTYNATIPQWGCPQFCGDGGIKDLCPPTVTMREDCLILSIFKPNTISQNTNYPIMIYFFGGGWMENYGGGSRLNASNVVNFTQDTIIVLVNYRLGAFGMLYDNELNLKGNFGHFDQNFAIEWMYNNSYVFGGDKDNIIIYGQSSGANSGLLHLIQNTSNPLIGKSLIKGIICESSASGQRWRTDNEWNDISKEFSLLLQCNFNQSNTKRLQCLKSKHWEEILAIQSEVSKNKHDMIKWSMSLKNDIFYDQPIISIKNGFYNKDISLIIGTVNCESCGDFKLNGHQSRQEFLDEWIPYYGEEVVNNVINYYDIPINDTSYNFANFTIQIHTDSMQKCSNRNILKNTVDIDNKYFYHFMYSSFNINSKLYSNQRCWSDVCHTEDLWWIFNDDLEHIIGQTWNDQELILKNQFLSYWTNFAAKGNNPNSNLNNITIEWNAFNINNNTNTLLFDIANKMQMVQNYDNQP
eukprot:284882_1